MPAKTKQTKQKDSGRVRRLDYRSKKKLIKTNEPIPGSFKILAASIGQIWRSKKLFGCLLLVYIVMYFLLVKGIAGNFSLSSTKEALEQSTAEGLTTATIGATLLGSLFGSAGTAASGAASAYQLFLFVIMSLALIWSLRHTYESAKKTKIRQAFYQGMHPLITYSLVWIVIILQLLPLLIGLTIYNIINSNGIAVGLIENILWLAFVIICLSCSVFLTSSSIFATYIVALPNMTPMQALKKAKSVVKFRRFAVIRKVLFFPLMLFVVAAAIFLPLVLYATLAAEIIFIVFMLFSIISWHSYMYNLYRKMI